MTRTEVESELPPAWAARFTDALDVWASGAAGPAVPVRVHDGTHLLSPGSPPG